MLNIVIPMAGAGSRFEKEGYTDPKPLIRVNGTPMIKAVVDNLRPTRPHRFIFICQQAHVEAYGLRDRLSAWAPGCAIVEITGLTEGAACTVLTATDLINTDAPLMIANSDQYVDADIDEYLGVLDRESLDGLIMTMWADDTKWSFVGLDDEGLVTRVVEKEVISNEATVGIYNFRTGRSFVHAAGSMIANNERVNNEFYVAPTYNQLIRAGGRIGIHNVGRVGEGMYGLGTPADLVAFLAHPVSRQLVDSRQ
jgi:NDP-sugar pyrophosphorylase family protein